LSYKSKTIIMRIANEVFERLDSDRELRLKLALALGVQEQSVEKSLKRRSDVFTKIASIRAISEHTGLTEEEILETVKA